MKIYLIFSFFILAFFYTGCIEVQTLLKVNEDGSGTIEETVMMNKEIVEMIGEFTASFSEDTLNPQKFEFFDEAKLKEQAINFGKATYLKGEKITTDEKEGYRAIYTFENINEIKFDQNPGRQMPIISEDTEPEEEGEFLTFSFIKDNPSEFTIKLPDKKSKKDNEEDEETAEEYDSLYTETDTLSKQQEMEEARRFLKDLKMSLVIRVNGTIKETNAMNVSGNDITLFSIDFNELLEDPDKWNEFMDEEPESFEDVKEIIKDIPGIKVELSNPVIIKF